MRSPHTIEIPFVFHNIAVAGPLISKVPEALALSDKVSEAWVAFARTGNPNTPGLPPDPPTPEATRDTMLFNTESRVERSWRKFSNLPERERPKCKDESTTGIR
jgi:para-nitrobenzyl esterase